MSDVAVKRKVLSNLSVGRHSGYRVCQGSLVAVCPIGGSTYDVAASIPSGAWVEGFSVEEIQAAQACTLSASYNGVSYAVPVAQKGFIAVNVVNDASNRSKVAVTRSNNATSEARVRVDVWWKEYGVAGSGVLTPQG